MILKVIGSNSLGNGYVLESDNEVLLIEAGVRFALVQKALKSDISKVVGAIVSHEHNDHSEYVKQYLKAGITVLALQSVFDSKEIGLLSHFGRVIVPNKGYRIGDFSVIPFLVKHDVPCLGFLVDHPEMGRLLFVTDTMMLEYTFPELNHIMIEANYSDSIINEKIESGMMPLSAKSRLMESHMELETTKEILRRNDISRVQNIILIHLSNGNSNEVQMLNEVQQVSGKSVYIAKKGVEVDLSKTPY